jgi:hypothetical protein
MILIEVKTFRAFKTYNQLMQAGQSVCNGFHLTCSNGPYGEKIGRGGGAASDDQGHRNGISKRGCCYRQLNLQYNPMHKLSIPSMACPEKGEEGVSQLFLIVQ